jgi:FkbM family methyltransferase
MQGSFEEAIQATAISMAISDGYDPHQQIPLRPNDIRVPTEIAMDGFSTPARPDMPDELVITSRWKQYRYRAAMKLLGQPDGNYQTLVHRTFNSPVGYTSHVGQDMWVAEVFNHHTTGYFLDFGAFDGLRISNTVYLEKRLNWRGICVEPNPTFFPALCANRSAICVNAALYEKSRETMDFVDAHGLSSFAHLVDDDKNAEQRKAATRGTIKVDTINPTELLDRFKAPAVIDYMSLDVEGAELDVLKAFDFGKHKVTLLTVEHNAMEPKRQSIRDYLEQFGYAVEGHRNDDFFWLKDFGFPNDPAKVLARVAEKYQVHAA